MTETRWQPGDILVHKKHPDLRREIVDVRRTGYGWKYPDLGERTPAGGENYWWSENSSDPTLTWEWRLESWDDAREV